MNLVCLSKITGKIIETLVCGDVPEKEPSRIEALKANAIRYGYKSEDVEVKFVNDSEFAEIMEASKTPEQIAAEQAKADRIAAKAQAFIDNLPSWLIVETAVNNIANLAAAKTFLMKLARVTYWLAKDRAD